MCILLHCPPESSIVRYVTHTVIVPMCSHDAKDVYDKLSAKPLPQSFAFMSSDCQTAVNCQSPPHNLIMMQHTSRASVHAVSESCHSPPDTRLVNTEGSGLESDVDAKYDTTKHNAFSSTKLRAEGQTKDSAEEASNSSMATTLPWSEELPPAAAVASISGKVR